MSNLLTVLKCFSFSFFFFIFSVFLLLVCSGSLLSPSLLHFFFVLFLSLSIFLLVHCFVLAFFSFFQICFSFSFLIFLMCWYRPLPWLSRFKLRFEIMPCGHQLAFNTKYSYMLYSHLHNSMNGRTHFFIKNISLILYSQKGWSFSGVWEMGGETYTKREDFFFFPYLLPGAKGWQCLHSLASLLETPPIGCVSLTRQRFFALCPNLTV